MKLFVRLMIAALFIALLLPFTILKDDDGDTLLSFTDFELPEFDLPDISLPDIPGFPDSDNITSSRESLDGKDIFYMWYDAEGNVHFTTEPPADGIEYTVKGFDPNTNVIQAVEVEDDAAGADKEMPVAAPGSGSDGSGNPYSKEGIEKLFKDAKNIEKILNQRMQDQESALNQ